MSKRMFNEAQEQEIIQEYRSGLSMSAIANERGCHYVTIQKVLKRNNIPRQDSRIIGFSQKQKSEMVAMYDSGKTSREIANHFGCDQGVILRHLKKIGVDLRPGQYEKQVTAVQEQTIIDLYEQGHTAEEAAAEVGFTQGLALSVLKRHNVERRNGRSFTPEEEQEIVKLYAVGGFSVRAIARAYGWDHHNLFWDVLKRQGVEQRSPADRNRIYELNNSVFDEIDNELAAYFLGFIYADGCVHNRSLIVKLSIKDRDFLTGIQEFLETEAEIKEYSQYHPGMDKTYEYASLVITDEYLANRLKSLGITTGRKHFDRCISQVPEHLHKHWFRGLFDGDGSFHSYKPGMSVVGQRKMLEFIRDLLAREVGTNPDIKIHKHPTAKISTLIYMGRPQCKRIAEWLYSDATIWLERKYDVVMGYPEPQTLTRGKDGRFVWIQ